MSKAVLISIRPEWCKLIIDGKKTIEVRKTKPKLKPPFKCYIYCTYGLGLIARYDACYPNILLEQKVSESKIWGNCCNGKAIGEFVCDKLVWVVSHPRIFAGYDLFHEQAIKDACLTIDEAEKYSGGKDVYGWHISDLKIFDKPKELSEFLKCNYTFDCGVCDYFDGFAMTCEKPKRPPQSWCYVEEIQ